ncbi:hypothetical protein FB562_1698 [Homoserinimonas aerilata]|uniref:TIGR01777 family protein n=1 Tax=Homoserinimonas aerilata TaxID=1162970 RepID=A0A542YKK0_9MICO|nr:TIGR01777 family oxidoreductase [Homoserinimonas aerilata]TQL48601.1 hypothetical protein FB562_1698 [Homoserinimonas aerilata]
MGITHSSTVMSPIADVFAWHTRPGAFTRLAPPWQPAELTKESESLEHGEAVLSLPGGLRWVARHDPNGFEPPFRFVDELVRDGVPGVLFRWRHTHEFVEAGPDATAVTDRVETPLGSRILRPMFVYRHRQLADDLSAHRWGAALSPAPLTVAVTGSSGLVGSALCALLSTGGHRVIRLVRRAAVGPDERTWDPMAPAADLLADVDAVVHLAGESIAGRFTEQHKRAIRESRIEPTRRLAALAASTATSVRTFVCASAIGIYGAERGDEVLTEQSPRGEGYLADVVSEWESATLPAEEAGIRVVSVRTGIVQSPRGGTLRLFRPLFSAGLGGRVASGEQWLSWIDIDDLLDVYLRALVDASVSGAVNAVAPQPVRNSDYTRTLAHVLRRPALLPVPSFGPRILLGAEGAQELAEADQLVSPAVLVDRGHRFRRPDLESSLRHQLGRVIR